PEQVAEVRSLIRRLRHQCTVILSTHILPEVEATCDRVIIIHRGRVLALDTPANLNRRLRPTSQVHLEVRAPAADAVRALRALPGGRGAEKAAAGDGTVVLTVSPGRARARRERLADAVLAPGWGLRELRPQTLTLEEIFLSLVGAEPVPAETSHEAA